MALTYVSPQEEVLRADPFVKTWRRLPSEYQASGLVLIKAYTTRSGAGARLSVVFCLPQRPCCPKCITLDPSSRNPHMSLLVGTRKTISLKSRHPHSPNPPPPLPESNTKKGDPRLVPANGSPSSLPTLRVDRHPPTPPSPTQRETCIISAPVPDNNSSVYAKFTLNRVVRRGGSFPLVQNMRVFRFNLGPSPFLLRFSFNIPFLSGRNRRSSSLVSRCLAFRRRCSWRTDEPDLLLAKEIQGEEAKKEAQCRGSVTHTRTGAWLLSFLSIFSVINLFLACPR